MAKRFAFFTRNGKVFSRIVEFEWVAGFSALQKKKCVRNMHQALGKQALEVSTKSDESLGVRLSAFNLKVGGKALESVFQASKAFEHGGPYVDLLNVSPKDAKRDERIRNSGKIVAFEYEGKKFPTEPKTLFYDWLYFQAVKECISEEDLKQLEKYECFTDIHFDHSKSINTQARSIVLIKVILQKFGCLPDCTQEEFTAFHKMHIVE